MDEPRLIPVGRIARPHGIRGAIKIQAYGETLASMQPGDGFYLRSRSAPGMAALTIGSIRGQGRQWVIEFVGVSDRESAGKLTGEEVFVPEDFIAPLEAGEYYHYQLIGLNVETPEGAKLGVLRSILETGSSDIYVVESEGREILVPAIEDVICEVDLENNRMVVDPPEGLIDDL